VFAPMVPLEALEPLLPVLPMVPSVPLETMVPQVPLERTISLTVDDEHNTKPVLMTFPAIENFPKEVHKAVKSRAADKEVSIKEFVEQALRYALANDHIIKKKSVVKSEESEDRQGTVRRGSPPNAAKASAKKLRHTRPERA
jgi:hypothetical protein